MSLRKYLEEQAAAFNIGRVHMPQIDDQEDFLTYLRSKGISSAWNYHTVDFIKPIQVDIDQTKVAAMAQQTNLKPIIVSDMGYILDGHHRYFAAVMNDESNISTYLVNTGINQLLAIANEYVEEGSDE